MNEHSRDDAKTQESESILHHSVKSQSRSFAALPRYTDYLKAGVPPGLMPQRELIDMASRLGNSNFLELITKKSSIDAVSVPIPLETIRNTASNRITTGPISLTEPLRSFSPEKPNRAFSVESLRDRSEYAGSQASPLQVPEGRSNGTISD